MADIAEIGFRADTDELDEANQKMKALKPSAEGVEKAAENLNTKLNKTNSVFGKLAKGGNTAKSVFGRLASGVKNLTTGLLGIATGVIAGFTFSNMIMSARELSSSIAELSTLLPVGSKELNKMQMAARQMADEFGTSAAFQIKAFYSAVSAGASDAAAATKIVNTANKLAIGGITDVTVGVDILTTAVNAYASTGLEAADASDALFVGMRAGKTTISELASGMGNIIPIAASLGVEFDEIVAGTSALTTQGLSTATAITSLRAILSGVAKPTSEAAKLAKKLGVDFSTTGLKAKGLAGFLEDVVEKTGGSADKLSVLFGSVEALNAALSFAGGGGAAFNNILEQMASKAGATNQALETVQKSLDARWNKMLQRLSNLATDLGYVFLSIIVPAGEAVFAIFDAIASIKFDGFSVQTQNMQIGIDNVTLAVKDEIKQLGLLQAVMKPGTILSLEAANAKLQEAKAIREKIQVAAEEQRQIVLSSEAYRSVIEEQHRLQDAMNALRTPGDDLEQMPLKMRDAYEGLQLELVAAINKQKELLQTAGVLSPEYTKANKTIAQLENAIAKAKNGQVILNGEVVEGIDLGTRLSTIDYASGLNAGANAASHLANMLGVGLETAIHYNNVLNSLAGIEVPQVGGKFSFSGNGVSDNFGVGSADIGFGNVKNSNVSNPVFKPLVSSKGNASLASGGAGGGGGSSAIEQEITQLQKLQEEYRNLSEPFNQAQAAHSALKDAMKNGIIDNDMFVESLERIEKAFIASGGTAEQWAKIVNEQTSIVAKQMRDVGERALNDLGDEFIDLMVEGEANFAQLAKSIIKDLLRIAWQALVVKPILDSLKGAGGGIGGLLSALFNAKGNAFDTSGVTEFAKGSAFQNTVVDGATPFLFGKGGANLGIMGEEGPEAVMPLTRGPNGSLGVQMYGGGARAKPPIKNEVSVSNTYLIDGAISEERVVENIKAHGEAAIETVKQSIVGWLNEYDMNGTM